MYTCIKINNLQFCIIIVHGRAKIDDITSKQPIKMLHIIISLAIRYVAGIAHFWLLIDAKVIYLDWNMDCHIEVVI